MKVTYVTLLHGMRAQGRGCEIKRMEVVMRRVLAVAALLLASSTAQAQYEFQYGGRTIRIDPDRGIVSIPGVYDNTPKKSKRTQDNQHKQAPQDAAVEPQAPQPAAPAAAPPATTAPAPVATAPAAPTAPASTATPPQQPSTTTATVAPADSAAVAPPPPPQVQQAAPSTPPPPAAGTVAVVPPPSTPVAPAPAAAQRQQTTVPAPVRDPNSPVGVWLTEEKEGKVRIESCGPNLCGYSVDAKTNLNGEQVLINMKPSPGQKWTGRIHDPNTGSNYDSTIALKGGDTLRVQGCAFGGMFCGGQTWTRVN